MNTTPLRVAPRKRTASKEDVTAVYDALLALKNRDECAKFLRDIATPQEISALAERFAIARLLAKDVSYRDAADETNASTTTVSRVAHWFHHGTGGYSLIISRLYKKGH